MPRPRCIGISVLFAWTVVGGFDGDDGEAIWALRIVHATSCPVDRSLIVPFITSSPHTHADTQRLLRVSPAFGPLRAAVLSVLVVESAYDFTVNNPLNLLRCPIDCVRMDIVYTRYVRVDPFPVVNHILSIPIRLNLRLTAACKLL